MFGRVVRYVSLLLACSLPLQTKVVAAQVQSEQVRPSVSISYADSTSPLLVEGRTRLVAELRVAGFDVELMTSSENGAATTPNIGGQASVYADVVLTAAPDQLEVAISNHSKAIANRLVLVGKRDDVAAVAIQAVEFLRAGLVPRFAGSSAAPAPASVSRSENDQSSLPSAESDEVPPLALDLGPTLLTNLGKGDRLALLSFRPSLALSTHWSLGVSVSAPVTSARFRASLGDARYRMWLAGVGADYVWFSSGRAEASLGAGLGLARVLSDGDPDGPLVPRKAAAWSLTLGLRAAFEYRLLPAFRAVFAAELLSFSPSPVVAVLTDERRLGSPAAVFGVAARLVL